MMELLPRPEQALCFSNPSRVAAQNTQNNQPNVYHLL
jgi:hypothetical protein